MGETQKAVPLLRQRVLPRLLVRLLRQLLPLPLLCQQLLGRYMVLVSVPNAKGTGPPLPASPKQPERPRGARRRGLWGR